MSLGLQPQSIGSWRTHSNVSGGLKVARVDTLAMGNDVFEKFVVVIKDLTHFGALFHHQIGGIIGMNILGTTGCQIDPRHGQLSLHPSGVADHSVPLILEDGESFRNAQFNGRMILMKVDTGSDSTSISSKDWAILATSGAVSTNQCTMADINGVATNCPQRKLRLECKLGDTIRDGFSVKDGGEENLLGMDFFQHHITTFNFKKGKACLKDWATNEALPCDPRVLH